MWLREQWAGLFRELLQKQSQQHQIASLSSEVSELRELNSTLKKYLEAIMSGITPDDSNKLIKSEQKRLEDIEVRERLKRNNWYQYVHGRYNITFENFLEAIRNSTSFEDFANHIGKICKNEKAVVDCRDSLFTYKSARNDLNDARSLLGLNKFNFFDKKFESTKK